MRLKPRQEGTATYAEYAEAGLGSDYLNDRENAKGTAKYTHGRAATEHVEALKR
jgi:hypothetical protein